jgi:hypothetical protein
MYSLFSDCSFAPEPERSLRLLLQTEPTSLSGHLRHPHIVQQSLLGLQLLNQLRRLLRDPKIVPALHRSALQVDLLSESL